MNKPSIHACTKPSPVSDTTQTGWGCQYIRTQFGKKRTSARKDLKAREEALALCDRQGAKLSQRDPSNLELARALFHLGAIHSKPTPQNAKKLLISWQVSRYP